MGDLSVQVVAPDAIEAHIESSEPSKTVLVKQKNGTSTSMSVEALLLLLLIEKTGYIEAEGKKIANDVDAVCKKMKLLDTLYKDVLELSEKDGSLDWKKKGLSPHLERARTEGFLLPAKEGVLPREERDALLRSITQQRDDLSTQGSQLNVKLNRCYSLRDDHFRQTTALLSTMNDSYKKIFRNIG